MQKLSFWEKITFVLLCLMGVFLIGLQVKPFAWLFLPIGLFILRFCRKDFSKDMLLIYFSLSLLGLVPITTDVSYLNFFVMGSILILAIAVPYVISRKVYKDHSIRFRFHHGRKWLKKEFLYIAITAILSYFLLPFYLKNSGAYLNWSVEPGVSFITRLFIGTNALGIWDELFFVSTVLGIFRKYLSFGWANFAQSILFTSFLYELGFTGWGPFMIFPFAILQGFIFRKTDSLFYVITIHLTLDLILFFALIWSYFPSWIPIFLG